MKLEDFKTSLKDTVPPDNVNVLLEALWYDAQQDWKSAHQLSQEEQSDNAAWVHAYLHRKEGDINNAKYWYKQAGKEFPEITFTDEWDEIAQALTRKL